MVNFSVLRKAKSKEKKSEDEKCIIIIKRGEKAFSSEIGSFV